MQSVAINTKVVSSNPAHDGVCSIQLYSCRWFATGRWFSPGTPVSSTNKTDRHDITEILLKVALNILTKLLMVLVANNINKFQLYISSKYFILSLQRHDITEILLKVALKTINPKPSYLTYTVMLFQNEYFAIYEIYKSNQLNNYRRSLLANWSPCLFCTAWKYSCIPCSQTDLQALLGQLNLIFDAWILHNFHVLFLHIVKYCWHRMNLKFHGDIHVVCCATL
jgi:hypothetical protein